MYSKRVNSSCIFDKSMLLNNNITLVNNHSYFMQSCPGNNLKLTMLLLCNRLIFSFIINVLLIYT